MPTIALAGTGDVHTVWLSWNTTATSAITVNSNQVWTSWIVNTTASTSQWSNWNTIVHETQEQRRAREEAHVRAMAEQKKAEEHRARAKRRARKLLVDHLDEVQRESYEKKGFFYLYTASGKKYRIDQGTHGNVKLIEEKENKILGSYCIQPADVPDEDAMLAQKLHLEMNEEEFLRVANFRRAA